MICIKIHPSKIWLSYYIMFERKVEYSSTSLEFGFNQPSSTLLLYSHARSLI